MPDRKHRQRLGRRGVVIDVVRHFLPMLRRAPSIKGKSCQNRREKGEEGAFLNAWDELMSRAVFYNLLFRCFRVKL